MLKILATTYGIVHFQILAFSMAHSSSPLIPLTMRDYEENFEAYQNSTCLQHLHTCKGEYLCNPTIGKCSCGKNCEILDSCIMGITELCNCNRDFLGVPRKTCLFLNPLNIITFQVQYNIPINSSEVNGSVQLIGILSKFIGILPEIIGDSNYVQGSSYIINYRY